MQVFWDKYIWRMEYYYATPSQLMRAIVLVKESFLKGSNTFPWWMMGNTRGDLQQPPYSAIDIHLLREQVAHNRANSDWHTLEQYSSFNNSPIKLKLESENLLLVLNTLFIEQLRHFRKTQFCLKGTLNLKMNNTSKKNKNLPTMLGSLHFLKLLNQKAKGAKHFQSPFEQSSGGRATAAASCLTETGLVSAQ